jgi:Calcium/calmodulin dependent protein kinase II association domain
MCHALAPNVLTHPMSTSAAVLTEKSNRAVKNRTTTSCSAQVSLLQKCLCCVVTRWLRADADTEKETELPPKAEETPEKAPVYYSTADPRLSGDEVKEVLGLFDSWNAALASGDPKKVADLYAENGVLLPTVSNSVRCDREGLLDYFTNFLKIQPQGTCLHTPRRVSGQYMVLLGRPWNFLALQRSLQSSYRPDNLHIC